jgi:hypothetical protein
MEDDKISSSTGKHKDKTWHFLPIPRSQRHHESFHSGLKMVMTQSPLLAEAMALVMAANVASKLMLQQVTFLTDNRSLAGAAAAKSHTEPLALWNICQQVATLKQVSRCFS